MRSVYLKNVLNKMLASIFKTKKNVSNALTFN